MVGVVLLSASAVPGLNFAIDPYSVFGTDNHLRQGSSVNERFGKIEYLTQNPKKYDSFIIGSSTMGLFDPKVAQEMRPDGRWYNLAFLAGTPPEALRALQALKRNGVEVREVAMGLDIFAFRKLEKSQRNSQREHPLATGQSEYGWLSSNLFASSAVDMLDRVQNSLEPQARITFDIAGTGRYYLNQWDREIAADHAQFIQKQLYGRTTTATDVGVTLVEQRFDELRELAAWLKDNGVAAHFWINPVHHQALRMMDAETMRLFRQKIGGVLGGVVGGVIDRPVGMPIAGALGKIADYSARSELCEDDTLFYDHNHFRPVVARQIMGEVLGAGR